MASSTTSTINNQNVKQNQDKDAGEYIDEKKCLEEDKVQYNWRGIEGQSRRVKCPSVVLYTNTKKKSVAPAILLDVDDDASNPQYVPKCELYYTHDNRTNCYTSSEGTISDNGSEENSDDDGSVCCYMKSRRASNKMRKSSTLIEATEETSTVTTDGTSSKRLLATSKVAATVANNSLDTVGELPKKPGRKFYDIDSLDKWSHDLYNELEQMPKTQDELLKTYGYNIRAELKAPQTDRHHKYGPSSITKYTRNWQDTQAYNGTKMKRGGLRVGSPNKNKNSSTNNDDYTTEFSILNKTKPSESTATAVEPSTVLDVL